MNGRKLYDHFCDALKSADEHRIYKAQTDLPGTVMGRDHGVDAIEPRAWPYLTTHDRTVWNILAARITPKKPRNP